MLTHPARSSMLLTIANGKTWLPNKVVYQHESILKSHLKKGHKLGVCQTRIFFERGLTYNHTRS